MKLPPPLWLHWIATAKSARLDDTVTASVVVQDPSGRIDVTREPISLETQVNIDAESVQWKHEGASWTGVILPKTAPGP